MVSKQICGDIVLFETSHKEIKLSVSIEQETVWLAQAQMVELFERDISVISRHINNIFKENELEKSVFVEIFDRSERNVSQS